MIRPDFEHLITMARLACITVSMVLATQNAAASAPVDTLPAPRPYSLDTGDKLRVKVPEWPDLTGEYKVGADQILTLPVVGDMPVGGLTPKAVGLTIADRLMKSGKLDNSPIVMVEVVQFRPFYVLGYVVKPGEFEYRPGLTVLQAVSLAGGAYRFSDPGLLRLDRDAITLRGEQTALTIRMKRLTMEAARVRAELSGAASISLAGSGLAPDDDPSVAALVTEQSAILTASLLTLSQEVEATATMRTLQQKEIASLNRQIESELRQLVAVQREISEAKSLAEKGLSTSPRLLLLERTTAQILGQKQSLETNVIRAEQNIAQAEQRLNLFRNERALKLNAEQTRLSAEAADLRTRFPTLQKLIVEAEVLTPTAVTQRYASQQETLRYTLLRTSPKGAEEFVASEVTLLEPGDVLKVQLKPELSATPVGIN